MPRPRIAIAMATYNGGAFIDAQLESIACQSRPPDQLVVCDDGSLDDCPQRIENFARHAPFEVRFERNADHLGTTANFERAISLCDADFILLSDQDDVWLPEKISLLVGKLEAVPELGLVFCNGGVVDEALQPLGYDLWRALFFDAGERARVREGGAAGVFLRHVVAAGNTLAFRGHFLGRLLPFPALPSSHDAWIAFAVALLSGVGLVEEKLIHYRLHASNQIGLRRFGLLDQYRQARRQLENNVLGQTAEFFEFARERFRDEIDCELRRLLDEKIEHTRLREGMSPSLLPRLPAILTEWRRGNYGRYGYGIRSVAQDIWLR